MKFLTSLFLTMTLISCNTVTKKNDFVTFSGTIKNAVNDSIFILNRTFEKVIALNEDGTFKDTLKVKDGTYYFSDGNENTMLYLKNGDELMMTLDTKEFDESIVFEGTGAINNNYLAKKSLFQEQLFSEDFGNLNEEELNLKLDELNEKMIAFITKNKEVDIALIEENKADVAQVIKGMKNYYLASIELKKELPKGKTSPTFENYETVDGGTVSLSDFKGKNVYIDVWATWCAPCKVEIPFLKELEHDYEGKDIAFISLSVDDDRSHKGSWDLARENWKKMVEEKALGGVQIFAPEGWKSSFITDYKIFGIPRFILIDKEGKIVTPDAPRPSSNNIRELIDGVL